MPDKPKKPRKLKVKQKKEHVHEHRVQVERGLTKQELLARMQEHGISI